jgi:hypothetical protein
LSAGSTNSPDIVTAIGDPLGCWWGERQRWPTAMLSDREAV